MRAVLDVNVLLSALISRTGAPAALLGRWLNGRFELVVSRQLLAELEGALAYPKIRDLVSPAEGTALIALLESGATLAADPGFAPPRSRDPGDDYLLALAESTNAILVSGDEDLLDLSPDLPVVSPADFLGRMQPED